MTINPFENDFIGRDGGMNEFSDEKRPNAEALEEKRDEYALEAVNAVVKNYDQKKIDTIAKGIDDLAANPEAAGLLDELVSDIEERLLVDHGVHLDELSVSGPTDTQDRRIINGLEEVQAAYPRDLIVGNIKALLGIGYF